MEIEWPTTPIDAGHYGRLALFVCPVCAAVVGEVAEQGAPYGEAARRQHEAFFHRSGDSTEPAT